MKLCPVCYQPDGFHDTDELWTPGYHRAARDQIPVHKRWPSSNEMKRQQKDEKTREVQTLQAAST